VSAALTANPILKHLISFIVLTVCPAFLHVVPAWSQQRSKLALYEDSLNHLGKMIVNGGDETDRKAATYKFIPLLVRALKQPASFDYKFDSVKSIRIVYAPDRTFRIFTWFVNINDIAYRFYGAIQMNSPSRLVLHPLIDATEKITNPEEAILTPASWYGAEYYEILPKDAAGNYVLLAWKGLSDELTSRLVDVLRFENGKPVFGARIFQGNKLLQSRLLFRYTHQASMMLKYLPQEHAIVMDHLSPPEKTLQGKYQFYGPDLTYDELMYSSGIWVTKENVILSNTSTPKDKDFIMPQKNPLKEK